jgi:hypothetical protein
MQEKVKEVQEYLKNRGITVAETSIVNTAINIATRWGGMGVFVCEFKKDGEK